MIAQQVAGLRALISEGYRSWIIIVERIQVQTLQVVFLRSRRWILHLWGPSGACVLLTRFSLSMRVIRRSVFMSAYVYEDMSGRCTMLMTLTCQFDCNEGPP